MDIEVEIRSFISEEKYEELLSFFRKEGKFIDEDYHETFYFDGYHDLRIQRANKYSKVWLKKGIINKGDRDNFIHDEQREEIEVKVPRDDFEKLESLFRALKFTIDIKWFRKRHTFEWEGISVMIDNTLGYGHIIELEKMADESEKDSVLLELKNKLASLEIPLTPKNVFDERYGYYRANWRELVQ